MHAYEGTAPVLPVRSRKVECSSDYVMPRSMMVFYEFQSLEIYTVDRERCFLL